MSTINWQTTFAALWRPRTGQLRAVSQLDPTRLEQLLGIERQKHALCANTERFLQRLPANNALLWGARGTGKSSLIKALINHYGDQGLRVVQIDRDQLIELPEIVDELREQPYRFIVYTDDLSFEQGDNSYRALKTVLDGSLELPPENVLIYATSNRRHLLPESMQDNLDSRVTSTELHYADAVEEKISLSDRFGLWLSFYAVSQSDYLMMVDALFPDCEYRAALHLEAIRFATGKGARSGRTARQFFNHRGSHSG
ncbi:ATP-binding protein [Motiliproteus sediminis]|uniref:ATP-binding protein n=1 Tax=Motiliproteus sediminis TaxID=1468178 RepID=UPI001AEF756A|nr:ATP-binding protein [Motiliproteus sediminis]